MRRLLSVLVCSLALSAANCDNPCIGMQCPDVERPDVGAGGDPNADWCSVYDEVFVPECAHCHSPSNGASGGTNATPTLKTRPGFEAEDLLHYLRNERAVGPPWLTPGEPDNSQIWVRVGEGSMPPGVKMGGSVAEDTRLRKLVRDWIANGATTTCNERPDAGPAGDAGAPPPPDAGTPEAGPPADTGPVDAGPPADPMCGVFSLLRTSCLGCHRTGSALGGFSLGDGTPPAVAAAIQGTSTVNDVPYVTPGNSDQSYLYLRIAGRGNEVGGRASRMPQGGQWPPEPIETLRAWIDNGAQNFVCP